MNLRVLKLWHLISINTSQCESRSDMQSSLSLSRSRSLSLSFCFCHLCREVKVEVKVLPHLQAAIVAECCCDCCDCCKCCPFAALPAIAADAKLTAATAALALFVALSGIHSLMKWILSFIYRFSTHE